MFAVKLLKEKANDKVGFLGEYFYDYVYWAFFHMPFAEGTCSDSFFLVSFRISPEDVNNVPFGYFQVIPKILFEVCN